MGRLPFKPFAPPKDPYERTLEVPVLNRFKGKTTPVGDNSIAKEVAALPFDDNRVGAAIVLFPRLKLQEYASLRAELSVWPERSAQILPRYQVVNEAARRALEEHWQMELAANPKERARIRGGPRGVHGLSAHVEAVARAFASAWSGPVLTGTSCALSQSFRQPAPEAAIRSKGSASREHG